MARRPDVFVRSLPMDEGRKLQRITRTAKDPVKLRRTIVVLMSGQGQTVRDITSLRTAQDRIRHRLTIRTWTHYPTTVA